MADKYNLLGKGGQAGKVMRTVFFTVCEGYEVMPDGYQRDFMDVLIGRYTPMRANRYFVRERKNQMISITRTKVFKQLVGMDFWQYWQYADPSEDPQLVEQYVLNNKIS